MSVANPRDLLLQQLSELLWIERKLFFEIIPAVHDAAHAPELQKALTAHRTETRTHCVRIEDAVRSIGAEPAAASSPPLDDMKKQHEEHAQQITHRVLRDVFHCAGVVRTEHYELACYDPAIQLARGARAQGMRPPARAEPRRRRGCAEEDREARVQVAGRTSALIP